MRRTILALAATALLSGAALAQGTPSPPPGPDPAPGPVLAAPPSPGTAPAARPGQGAARMACQSEVDAKSLTGPERKAEMQACMKARADACRRNAADAHIPARNGERREFVKHCMQQGA